MSKNVKVPYGKGAENATLLLAAAEEMDMDPSVVRTTSYGFEVPEEVAKKAGVDIDTSDDDFAKEVAEAEKEVEEPAEQQGFADQSPTESKPAKKAAKKTPAKKAAKSGKES